VDASNASSRHIQAVPDEAPVKARRPLGEILIELGFVSRADVDAALEAQRTAGGRIGEILVDRGCLTRIDLACGLAEQWEPYPSTDAGDGAQADGAAQSTTDQPPPEAPPRLAALKSVDETVAELARSVDRLTTAREADALALDERFAAFALRLDRIESQAGEIAQLETRLAAVSELATDLRDELGAQVQQDTGTEPGERLLELSLRIDSAAKGSHDRIVALADELRADIATRSAAFDARLQAQLDAVAAVEQRFEDVHEAAAAALARAEETTEALHVETGSLAGRLDELFGLRHADTQVARVANERLAARVAEITTSRADEGTLERLATDVAELTRRVEQLDSFGEAAIRAIERTILEGLADLGKKLTAKATKQGKQGKGMRRSLDSLEAAIAAADATLAEHDSAGEKP
jgi:hypothetical protein